jgi:hypothetical protein
VRLIVHASPGARVPSGRSSRPSACRVTTATPLCRSIPMIGIGVTASVPRLLSAAVRRRRESRERPPRHGYLACTTRLVWTSTWRVCFFP